MTQLRITIRPLRLSDADDIYELMHMPNVLQGTSVLPSTSVDAWRRTIEQWVHDERLHIFVAEVQGKVIGKVRLEVGQGRTKHQANLSVVVHDKYQGQGFGKMLLLTAIDLADNWLNLLRLELDVYIDNERALRLYKNFDFAIEGHRRCSGFRNGGYIDSYLMARLRPQAQQGYVETLTQTSSAPKAREADEPTE